METKYHVVGFTTDPPFPRNLRTTASAMIDPNISVEMLGNLPLIRIRDAVSKPKSAFRYQKMPNFTLYYQGVFLQYSRTILLCCSSINTEIDNCCSRKSVTISRLRNYNPPVLLSLLFTVAAALSSAASPTIENVENCLNSIAS